jgi:hypothetical protein
MFKLSKDTLKVIEQDVGLTVDELTDMDHEDIHGHIETKAGHALPYSSHPLDSRGSVFLWSGRFISLKKVEEYLSGIAKRV